MIRSALFALVHSALLLVLLGYSLYQEWGLWRSVGPRDVWLVLLAGATGALLSGMAVWHRCASRPKAIEEIAWPGDGGDRAIVLPFPGARRPAPSRRS